MTQKFLYPLRDFSLGQNDKDAPNLIPDNALVEAKNAILGKGFVAKRHGYQRYSNQLGNPITTLFEYYKFDGSREFLAVSNNQLYKDSSGTLNAITGTLTTNDAKMIAYKNRSIQDVVLIADKGKLKVYNGTSVSEVVPYSPTTQEQGNPGLNDLNNLTNFRAIAIKKDRIFAAAHPTVKNRISFCHRDPYIGYAVFDYWPAPFFIDVATEDNDEIVELKVFRDALIILCKRSIWALYGDGITINDYQLLKINVPTGCIAPNSVQIVGNDLFYLAEDHVYRLFTTDQNFISAVIVSENIENTLKSIPRSDKEKAVGAFFDNKYYLSFPNGTCLVYDTLLGSWVKWTNVQANSFLSRDGVLFFSSNTGYIYKFDETVYNDDGQPISFSITTKNFDFGYDVQDKKIRRIWTVAKQYDQLSSSFTLKAKIDYVETTLTDISTDQSLVWDEGNWDETFWDWVDVVRNELRIRYRGKNIQLIIENNELNEPLTIYGIVFQYKLKRP
ncbi:hypothetical protein P9848_12610 [Geobacillus stearothermophilus]|uniref:hypothetical protein n=1 Tax=Geobacillus stearothermophilus TaxID=1422 RepID=UPI002E244DA8|nr:hypothetical protein [Geobacillus stearothermophilus]